MEGRCDGGAVDEARFQAWLNLLQGYSVVSARIETELEASIGLSLPEHEVLVRLAQAPERKLRMFDLASLLLLSKSGVTRLVDRLERRGLVVRQMSAEDRRVVLAGLTDEGLKTFERARPVLAAAIEQYFAQHLADHEVSELRAALRKVLEGNGEWHELRCSPAYEQATASSPAS
jgi:DNA-binding MarR family transcriptional regulator